MRTGGLTFETWARDVAFGVEAGSPPRGPDAATVTESMKAPSPSPEDPGDTGWHIDVSFGTESPDFMAWRANIHSKGRALLMLFLFSDVSGEDAPTRIRVGSHADIARQLAPAGEPGLTLGALAADGFAGSAHRPVVHATGDAGTVYLCHPFLVHAAQVHQGTRPRFLAQPPLLPVDSSGRTSTERHPVEEATARALSMQDRAS